MNSPQEIEVKIQKRDDAVVVQPHGEIDLSTAPSLKHHLSTVQTDAPATLIVDLSAVPYMDSSGVATLLEAMQMARRQGNRLLLCCLQDKVRSIFEIARLDLVFSIFDSADEAMAS